MLRDRQGKMWRMWAQGGWGFRPLGSKACFEEGWQHFDFDDALKGGGCNRNWLEGVAPWPHFPKPAPALLGFDETIYAYCSAATGLEEGPFYQDNVALGRRCVDANENVLRVMGGWNMCVNLQWQTCAMLGKLHGQGGKTMHFSIAPKELDYGIFEHPTKLVGDYAISDVYFVEVCVVSHVCKNRAELFSLGVGTLFECEFDTQSFLELRSLLRGSA